jgi:hypothetical protein
MKLFISSCIYKENENLDSSSLVYRIPCVHFEKNGWKVASITQLPNLTLNNIEALFGSKPEAILIWLCGSYVSKNKAFLRRVKKYKFGIKMYWYIDDIHNNAKMRLGLLNYFDLVLNSYAYCFKMFYAINVKTYWFPHYVNESLLTEIAYNHCPIPKILLSGQVTEYIYPARHKALLIARDHSDIDYLNHPGYNDRNKHDYCGSKYYFLINRYLAAFTCCAKENRPYIVSKFFEIIACGTLLIAYDVHVKQELKELGFIENVNYIACTLENMQEVFDYVINENNRKKIDTIRRNGFELSKQNSFLCHRVSEFCEYIDAEKYVAVR